MCKETMPQRECGVVIIGAGLEALSIVTRLPPTVAQNATVIDPSGEWLHSWSTRCQKLGVSHLRSPITQHPGASPLELRSFIEKQGLEKELLEVIPGHSPVPSAELLLKFCQERIISQLPLSVRSIVKDTVLNIQPINQPKNEESTEKEENNEEEDDGNFSTGVVQEEEEMGPQPSCILHLASGRTLPARAVIVSCSHCTPVVPTWAREYLHKEKEEKEKEIANQRQISILNKSEKIKTWDQIDLTDKEFQEDNIKNKRIVIIGGGMTAASLALGAISQGATSVTVISRRPLVQHPFNCDIGWWGNKNLNAFWQEQNPENRMKMCRQARYQASITPQIGAAVEDAILKSEKIKIIQGYQVESATDSKSDSSSVSIQLKFCPTPNVDISKISSFLPSTAATDSSSFSETAPSLNNSPSSKTEKADCVWLACGSAYNITRHPLLSHLQAIVPTRIVAGYPVIDPGTCLWPGAPVYIIGKGALLAIGPCTGELAGMRLAAERITKSLKKLDYSGKTEWETAAEVLAPQLALPTAPAAAPVATPAAAGEADGGQSSGVSTLQPRTILENYLELEENGIMCYERRIKPSVARPSHLIDISDLPPPSELPRQEIQKFSFSEEDFEICVVVQLPEAVALPSVRSLITERSLEVWAIGEEGMYRLHEPRLYGKVLPSRCKIRVNESRKKLYVVLYKEKDAEWRFLKGI